MTTHRPPLTQADVEEQIMAMCDALARQTEDYDSASFEAATAEADYKLAIARNWLSVAADGHKMSVVERNMRADILANDALRTFKINEAKRAATREALLSYRARIDALRTLSANVRAQT